MRRLRGSWHRGETSTQLSATMVTCAVTRPYLQPVSYDLTFSGSWYAAVGQPMADANYKPTRAHRWRRTTK